ncbi:MAG: hypothetical protein ABI318_18235 [Chthoniobacteraceae bacterium]
MPFPLRCGKRRFPDCHVLLDIRYSHLGFGCAADHALHRLYVAWHPAFQAKGRKWLGPQPGENELVSYFLSAVGVFYGLAQIAASLTKLQRQLGAKASPEALQQELDRILGNLVPLEGGFSRAEDAGSDHKPIAATAP